MEQTISIIVFLAVIGLIVVNKFHEAVIAVAGAVVLLLTQVLDVESAASYIDYNTIGVLIGMMLFVNVLKHSGMFEYIAIKSAKIAKGDRQNRQRRPVANNDALCHRYRCFVRIFGQRYNCTVDWSNDNFYYKNPWSQSCTLSDVTGAGIQHGRYGHTHR